MTARSLCGLPVGGGGSSLYRSTKCVFKTGRKGDFLLKRYLCIALAVCLLWSLAACGKKKNTGSSSSTEASSGAVSQAASSSGDAPALAPEASIPAKWGNSASNLANGSMAVRGGDRYYLAFSGDQNRLYSMDPDTRTLQKMGDDTVSSLNYAEGTIYYRNDSENGALYKIGVDGTGRQKLDDAQVITLSLYDGWLYFRDGAQKASIWKIRIDGSEKTRLGDMEETYGLTLSENWVYYMTYTLVEDSDDSYVEKTTVYRMDFNGEHTQKLYEVSGNTQLTGLQFQGGYLYYAALQRGNYTYTIARIAADGTSKDAESYSVTAGASFAVNGDILYYVNFDTFDYTFSLRRQDVTRENAEIVLSEHDAASITLLDSHVFFVDKEYKSQTETVYTQMMMANNGTDRMNLQG